MKTYSEMKSDFAEIAESIPADDKPALNEAWNNYTDSVCKDGEITSLQYHYCPSYEDVNNDDEEEDIAYILREMNLYPECIHLHADAEGKRFYDCTLTRGNSAPYRFPFHWWRAAPDPDVVTVLPCLFSDARCVDWEGSDLRAAVNYADAEGLLDEGTFRESLDKVGACMRSAEALKAMFTESERDDLQAMFDDCGL